MERFFMERLKYIVEDSTIAELLGVQNFTNKESAILELVKNAYDAQANNVSITFSDRSIVIIDDGIGMSKSTICENWMHVGKSDKGYSLSGTEDNDGRVLAGSKGVGRFALARLGASVNVYSAKKTSVYKGYKQDKIEMRGDRAEMSDFPLYLNTVAGGLDRRDQTIGGFSFVVKIYALPVVEIIG